MNIVDETSRARKNLNCFDSNVTKKYNDLSLITHCDAFDGCTRFDVMSHYLNSRTSFIGFFSLSENVMNRTFHKRVNYKTYRRGFFFF